MVELPEPSLDPLGGVVSGLKSSGELVYVPDSGFGLEILDFGLTPSMSIKNSGVFGFRCYWERTRSMVEFPDASSDPLGGVSASMLSMKSTVGAHCPEFRVQGSGFRAQGSGFRVQG